MSHRESLAFAGGGMFEMATIVASLIIATPLVVFGGKLALPRHPSAIYGSTDWASSRDLARLNKGLEIRFDPATKRRVRVQVEGNLLTIAPPRTGKTSGFIIPNLTWPEPNAWCGPAVVIDPKGDAFFAVRRRRKALGKTVRCLDPLGLVGGEDRWNPLLRVSATDVLSMQAVARSLLPNSGHSSDNSEYFTISAVDVIVGAMIATIKDGHPDPVGAAGLLHSTANLRDALAHNVDEASKAALEILKMEERSRDQILASARQATQWLRDAKMQSVVKSHTFEMTDLLSGAVDLFIVMPADEMKKKILAPYVRWLLSDLFAAFRSGRAKERALVFVDEANVLGKFDALLDGAGELPGYGVSLWTIWHNRSQIAGLYGESGAETMQATAEVINLFNLSRALPDEVEHWSKAIGSFTGYSSTSTTDKSGAKTESTGAAEFRLVPATDLPKLLQKQQIVFLTSPNLTANPIKLGRTQAHKDPRFKGLIDPRPPIGRIR
jgi:type IV secretion system protein VirD4